MENQNVKNLEKKQPTTTVNKDQIQKKIEFVPDISIMRITTEQIAASLYSNLVKQIPNYAGSRVQISNNQITIQISFVPSPEMCIESNLVGFDISLDEMYSLTEKCKKILTPYVNPDMEIPIKPIRQHRKTYLIVTLNPLKTLNGLLEEPPKGYEYTIEGVKSLKNKNSAVLSISLKKKVQKKNKR